MQLFIAFNVEDDFKYLRENINSIGEKLNILSSKYYLPFHISLKNNFTVSSEVLDEVINTLDEYVSKMKTHRVKVKGIEISNKIVWLRMHNDTFLRKIHSDLDRILKKRFNIIRHRIDFDYKFHVTLFMDEDISKINEAYLKIKTIDIPKNIELNKILIGLSLDGEIGSYKVYKEYKLD